jgi:RimK family alpha-L-glutamate ligase
MTAKRDVHLRMRRINLGKVSPSRDLLIITCSPIKHSIKRLAFEGTKLGWSVLVIKYSQINLLVGEGVEFKLHEHLIKSPNVIILDMPGPYTAVRNVLVNHYAQTEDTFIPNAQSLIMCSSMNKLIQAYFLAQDNIPIIPTRWSATSADILDTINGLPSEQVMKFIYGGEGNGVFHIQKPVDSFKALSRYESYNMIYQPKLNGAREFRVIVIGDITIGVEKFSAEDDFRANWAKGGRFTMVPIPQSVVEIARRSCQSLHCQIAAVDIMYTNDDECFILELNRHFGFEGFELATNKNIAQMIVKWIETQVGDVN